jgi:hypothetical protein
MNRYFGMGLGLGCLGLFLCLSPLHARSLIQMSTLAERTQWKQTGRYEEVLRLCDRFQLAYPKQVRCTRFGTTPEGRPMVALVASGDGTLTPKLAARRHRTVVLAQGAIHAGECDGKDAGFYVLEDLLATHPEVGQDLLKKVTFVFVPVFNVDGHERFGPHNRPNQVGPEEMGWRVTSHNLNLNRDYAKAESPEMGAMLGLLDAWDPILYADLHVTDGAQFQHQIALITQPQRDARPALIAEASKLGKEVQARLEAKKRLPLLFYPEFRSEDDPASGFEGDATPLRFAHGYWGLRNRLAILVETHSWKDYATRVGATIETVQALLELAARDGSAWRRAADEADREGEGLAGKTVPLSFEAGTNSHPIEFQGFAYKREKSEISGGTMITYDPSKAEVWHVPYFDEMLPKVQAVAPERGYWIPPAHAMWMEEKLRLHGVSYRHITKSSELEVETFRSLEPELSAKSFEGRQALSLKGSWKKGETRQIPAGSLFVPIAQKNSRLAVHLFEPDSRDSFLAWGFFNAHFERKEYMEPYVAESVAREMLAKDPAVKAEFERRLRDDAEFAKSPEKRLEFFYRRHPSWDERQGLYPIFRQ